MKKHIYFAITIMLTVTLAALVSAKEVEEQKSTDPYDKGLFWKIEKDLDRVEKSAKR